MHDFNGRWIYQSFCAARGSASTAPQIAAPWSPQGELTVNTDAETGKVRGTLSFGSRVALEITGSITPGDATLPEGIELTGEGLSSISRLRGFFAAGARDTVIGTVVALQNDLAKQPEGTSGPFLLRRSTTS